jgi:hypothetical protein
MFKQRGIWGIVEKKRRENRSLEKNGQNRYQMGAGHLPDCSKNYEGPQGV